MTHLLQILQSCQFQRRVIAFQTEIYKMHVIRFLTENIQIGHCQEDEGHCETQVIHFFKTFRLNHASEKGLVPGALKLIHEHAQ